MRHRACVEEIVIERPGYRLPSSVVLPASETPVPCIVFFAGSGPTDRDWTSPFLPGTNGSGRQLALALQERGIGSIRSDKVGSGVNMPAPGDPESLRMLDVLSLDHYVDEAAAAFETLVGRERCGQVFLLGHSEGSIHASSAAVRLEDHPRFGGLISLSGPSRSLLDTAMEQIRAIRVQAGGDPAVVDAALGRFRAAMLDDAAPAPDLAAIPEAAGLWHAMHDPHQQAVARQLILADPLASLREYRGRALVVSAANDAQVPPSDGDRIAAALRDTASEIGRVTIADANHVYKSEPRPPATLDQATILAGYADEGHPLAEGLVDAIAGFITPA